MAEGAPRTSRALLVPGNDLPAEFYAPACAELSARGVATEYAELRATRWPDLVAGVVSLIDAHACDTLIAHSFGGLVGLLAAAAHPAPLRRLILVEPAVVPSKRWATLFSARYRRRVIDTDRSAFANDVGVFRRIADPSRFPRAALEHHLRARKHADPAVQARLFTEMPGLYPLPFAAISIPVLFIEGAESGWRPRLLNRLVRRALRSSETVTIPGAGHWLFNEQDAALAETMASFCKRAAIEFPGATEGVRDR